MNPPTPPPGARLIPLTKGQFAIVDEADYQWVSKFTWYFTGGYAARARRCRHCGGSERIWMHREVWKAHEKELIDHINGNGLDNRKNNLREASPQQNMANKGPQNGKIRRNVTGYKGVIITESGTFAARIAVGSRRIFLGTYPTSEQAARAYDHAAIEHHGQFARRNFPEEPTQTPKGKRPKKCSFRGVYHLPHDRSRFFASITVKYKQQYLGIFTTPEEAARAYDTAALKHHGVKAKLNFQGVHVTAPHPTSPDVPSAELGK